MKSSKKHIIKYQTYYNKPCGFDFVILKQNREVLKMFCIL